jgi:hypothetical protein
MLMFVAGFFTGVGVLIGAVILDTRLDRASRRREMARRRIAT